MNKLTKVLIFVFIIMVLVSPATSLAQERTALIPCGTDANPEQCTFTDFITLINRVIDYLIFYLALPLSAIMFAYAGFLLVTAGGGEAKTKAKGIFFNVLWGLLLAVGAWLIVKTLLSIAGYNDTGLFFKV